MVKFIKIISSALLLLLAYLLVFRYIHNDNSHGYKLFFLRKDILTGVRLDYLFFSAALGFGIIYFAQNTEKYGRVLIIALILSLALMLNLFICRPTDYSWNIRVISNLTATINPFYTKGLSISNPSSYPQEHVKFARKGYRNVYAEESRLTSYPPGLPLLYYCLSVFSDKNPYLSDYFYRTACQQLNAFSGESGFDIPLDNKKFISTSYCAVILTLLAYLFMLCMAYFLALMVSDSEKAAFALCFLIFMPSIQLFSNTSDIFFPGLSLLVVYVLMRGLMKDNSLLVMSSGIILICSMFFTFAFLPLIPISLLIILFSSLGNKRLVPTLMKNYGLWFSGLIGAFMILLFLGYNTVEMCLIALKTNREFYQLYDRTYILSMPLNIMELLYFTGFLPLVYLAYLFFSKTKDKINSIKDHVIKFQPKEVLFFSFVIVLLILITSGGARGEVARNWLMYFPLISISVAACGSFDNFSFRRLSIYLLAILLVISSITEVTFCFWT